MTPLSEVICFESYKIVNMIQVESTHCQGVLQSQSTIITAVIPHIGLTSVTYYCWCKENINIQVGQLKRLKKREKENEGLCRAISDLTLDKLILNETAKENFLGEFELLCQQHFFTRLGSFYLQRNAYPLESSC